MTMSMRGNLASAHFTPAVEVREVSIAHPQVRTELLLHGDLTPESIGPNPAHRRARCVRGPDDEPIDIDDGELGDQRVTPQVDQSKGSADGLRHAAGLVPIIDRLCRGQNWTARDICPGRS